VTAPGPEPDVGTGGTDGSGRLDQVDVVDRPERGSAASLALHWRTALLLVAAFVSLLLLSVTMLIPTHYVILNPGPTINTLGKDGGHDLITVSGHPTYPARGRLDLTTVVVQGGPGSWLSVYDVLVGWLRRDRMVVPEDVLYPPGRTVESERKENQEEMVSSQEAATVAALRELGITVPTTITVKAVDGGSPTSPLRPGDVLVSVAGTRIVDLDTLEGLLKNVKAGTPVTVTVRRDGAERALTVPTRSFEGRRTILGIRVDPSFNPPFDVKIRIDRVGGPSAGTMFALGIIDVLTPGDLTGGAHVAGTGTITENGEVGAIGGIQQKVVGARNAGARWFLAPADNCADIVGHVPDGLRVVSVRDLHDARLAVEGIAAGQTGSLTYCSASSGRG
jgi:Lon-like protease